LIRGRLPFSLRGTDEPKEHVENVLLEAPKRNLGEAAITHGLSLFSFLVEQPYWIITNRRVENSKCSSGFYDLAIQDSSRATCTTQRMAQPSTSRSPTPSSSTTKRLIRELNEYSNSPNEALLHLGPVSDDDLLHWEAVLKGVKGTPYEGEVWQPPDRIPAATVD
jgi:hypothetical protein